MKLYLSATFAVIFFLISGSSVLADGTPTPEPIFKTPTPGATEYYDCPDPGELVGYGTQTPSVEWMMRCGLCLSTQSAPTLEATPYPTMEGTPGTPYPTPEPTATEVQEWEEQIVPYLEFGAFGQPGEVNTIGHSLMDSYQLVSGYGYIDVLLQGHSWYLNSNIGNVTVKCDGRLYWNESDYGVRWSGTSSVIYGDDSAYVTLNQVGQNEDIGWLYIYCETLYPHNFDYQVSGIEALNSWGFNLKVRQNNLWEPEPSPTPSSSYCGEIEEAGEGGFNAFDVEGQFTIPVPALGVANCIVLMPEFTIPVTAINIIPGINIENDIYFPGVTLCVRAMTLGTLKLLGMGIDLDFYAVIVGAMMILRKVLRS